MSSDTATRYDGLIAKAKAFGKKRFPLNKFPFKNRLVIGVLRQIKAIVKHDDGTYSVNGHMKDLTGESLAAMVSKKWSKHPRKYSRHEPAKESPDSGLNVVAKEIMTVSSRLTNIESFLFRIAAEGKVVA